MVVSTRNPAMGEGFGELLRQFRTLAGLSQEALAAQAGLSARAISDLERGVKTHPHPDTIRRLADALSLPLSGRAALVAAARPPARPAASQPATVVFRDLPVWPTPLIGRDDEAAEAARLLAESTTRLLSLTGPGGVGKSRLAVEVAGRLRDRFAGGIAFIELAPLNDPGLVLGAVAQSLGVREKPERMLLEEVTAHLRGKQVLLLLDNFEHVLEAAILVAGLLDTCPSLSVLATSREPLRIRAEQEFPVPPLAFPGDDRLPDIEELGGYGAVKLFVQRVRAVRPGFGLTSGVAPAVADICRRLDGLPLAIELAAAWSGALSPSALLTRLEPSLPLLNRGARDLPDRQRTMRNCIAWSYDLLSPEEQALLRHLAGFVGSFTIEAAEAVIGSRESDKPAPDSRLSSPDLVLDGLASLCEKSLIRTMEPADDEPRYQMLETIREYGLEQLAAHDELEEVYRVHAEYFLSLAARAEQALQGPGQAIWLDRLVADFGNLRDVFNRSMARGDTEAALRLGHALRRFWRNRGHRREGRAWLERALAAPGPDVPLQLVADAHISLGSLAVDRGDYDEAKAQFLASLEICRQIGDRTGTAHSLDALGVVASDRAAYAEARALHEEALAIRRESGNRRDLAYSLYNLAHLAREEEAYARALDLYRESLTIWEELDDASTAAYVRLAAGITSRLQGKLGDAVRFTDQSLLLFREVEDSHGVGAATAELGRIAHRLGDDAAAAHHFSAILAGLAEDTAEPDMAHNWIEAVEGLAQICLARGDAVPAARLFAAVTTQRDALNLPAPSRADRDAQRELLSRAKEANESQWDSDWDEGQSLTREQIIHEALLTGESARLAERRNE